MNIIRNEQEFLSHLDVTTRAAAERHVYKYTDCGAWLRFLPNRKGIELGSIVEGSDAEVSTDPLLYPFSEADYDMTIAYIESEADALWHEANDGQDEMGELYKAALSRGQP